VPDYYGGFIELDVFFPPIKPLKRELLKEWAKALPNDRIIEVRYSDDNSRAGVELKTATGRRIYYVFDRGRIMSFDISEVPRIHRNEVKRLLMKFIPETGRNRLISRAFRVKTPNYDDIIRAYFEWNTYQNLAEVWRVEAIKKAYFRKTNVEDAKIIPVHAPNDGEETSFNEVQTLEYSNDKNNYVARFYFDSITVYTKNRRNAYHFVIGSRNIFLNWEWWRRPDVGLFFV